jgi:hypothetical protein
VLPQTSPPTPEPPPPCAATPAAVAAAARRKARGDMVVVWGVRSFRSRPSVIDGERADVNGTYLLSLPL